MKSLKRRKRGLEKVQNRMIANGNYLVDEMLKAPEENRPMWEMLIARNNVSLAMTMLDSKFNELAAVDKDKALSFAKAAEKVLSDLEYEMIALALVDSDEY